ncbi:hypothetical protein CEXT_414901 [Caerostris extrusa]|uniref:Uncharacterized protein n=1 Tax=Caerostris extrusa TaxID=172846 RepID=A0AAV4REJ0_CAEEX|nr:hypothetical protein CEXT_414901 [Caerostris extrusa]
MQIPSIQAAASDWLKRLTYAFPMSIELPKSLLLLNHYFRKVTPADNVTQDLRVSIELRDSRTATKVPQLVNPREPMNYRHISVRGASRQITSVIFSPSCRFDEADDYHRIKL